MAASRVAKARLDTFIFSIRTSSGGDGGGGFIGIVEAVSGTDLSISCRNGGRSFVKCKGDGVEPFFTNFSSLVASFAGFTCPSGGEEDDAELETLSSAHP
jgi:hypothetical protein